MPALEQLLWYLICFWSRANAITQSYVRFAVTFLLLASLSAGLYSFADKMELWLRRRGKFFETHLTGVNFLIRVAAFVLLPSLIGWLAPVRPLVPKSPPSSQLGVGVVVLIAVVAALVLFFLKITYPQLYAGLEILFAVGFLIQTAIAITDPWHPSLGDEFKLGGSIYVLIRGLDNLKKHLEDRGNSLFKESSEFARESSNPNQNQWPHIDFEDLEED